MCIYAPGHKDRKDFYDNLNTYLNDFRRYNIIFYGVFNFVYSDVDRQPHLTKYDKQNLLKPKKFNLKDVFHLKHPAAVGFTHKAYRIDRIYISKTLLNIVQQVKH